jgi:hypothetical protein
MYLYSIPLLYTALFSKIHFHVHFIHVLFHFIEDSCNHTFEFFELSTPLLYIASVCMGIWLCRCYVSLFFHISCVSELRFKHLKPQSLVVTFNYQRSAVDVFSVFRQDSIVEGL